MRETVRLGYSVPRPYFGHLPWHAGALRSDTCGGFHPCSKRRRFILMNDRAHNVTVRVDPTVDDRPFVDNGNGRCSRVFQPDPEPVTKESVPSPYVKHDNCSAPMLRFHPAPTPENTTAPEVETTLGPITISGQSKCGPPTTCDLTTGVCCTLGPITVR